MGNSYSPSTGKAKEGDQVQGLFGIGGGVLFPQKDNIWFLLHNNLSSGRKDRWAKAAATRTVWLGQLPLSTLS